MHKEEYYRLITLHLTEEISEADQKKLEHWLKESPDHTNIYTEIVQAWKAADLQYQASHSDHAFEKIKAKLNIPDNLSAEPLKGRRRIISKNSFLKIAASFALLLAAAAIFLFKYDESDHGLLTKYTSFGEKTKIVLPDSSIVWLNAKSTFHYPTAFLEETREVYLTGEAFFEVTSNRDKPFVIHLSDNNQIKVLGTSFNVKSYEEDNSIETTVETGKVAFISHSETSLDSILIHPANKISFLKDSHKVVHQKANVAAEMAWLNDKFVFEETPLIDIANTLTRNYDITFNFESEALKNCLLTGTFESQPMEEILLVLSMTKIFQYEIIDNKVYISGKGCSD